MFRMSKSFGSWVRRTPTFRVLSYGVLILSLGASAFAQHTARVTGTITDPSGAVVPGAQVAIINQATGVSTEVESNEAGNYTFPFLIPGPYQLRVDSPGFRRLERPNLAIESGQVLPLNVQLQLGETTEVVTVTAETPLLQSSTAALDQLIERKHVEDMPLNNRRALSVIRLMGNMSFSRDGASGGGEGLTDFVLAGGRNRAEVWLMDGGNIGIVTLITGAVSFNPPAAAVQEVKIEVNGYPAEFGRTQSGVISMTTKSGTNRFHGEAYEFFRNDALDARTFFARDIAPRRFNVFGGTIGGPIIKDRTHFFFSYERNERRAGSTRVLDLPTTAEIGGDFSGRSGSLLDPDTGQPFPGNIIPASRLDPVGSFFAKLYPTPNVSGAPSGVNNFIQNTSNKNQSDSFIVRLDHVFSPSDRIFVRHVDFRSEVRDQPIFPGNADPFGQNANSVDPFFTTTWHHNFSPTLINEARFTHSRRSNIHVELASGSNLVQESGLKGVPNTDGMARLSLTGLTGIGRSFARIIEPQRTTQIHESVTSIRGNHTLKFGGELRHSHAPDWGQDIRSGAFSFNDVAVGRGFALASLLLGRANTGEMRDNPLLKSNSTYVGVYFQDDWKVSPRLTLNYGLRWDMDTPRFELDDQQSGFDPFAINPVSGTPGVFTFVGLDGLDRKHAHNFDKNNYGPRFGFAWRPWGDSTVVRGGYGLMSGVIYNFSTGRSAGQGFGDIRKFESPDNGFTPALLLRDGLPTPPPEPLGPAFGAVPVGQLPRQNGTFFGSPGDGDHPINYAHHINFSIQQQLRGNVLLEGSYLANLGHRVTDVSQQNINQIHPDNAPGTRTNLQVLRPFPQFSTLTWVAPNWGNSSYHALNLKLEKRYSAGLNLLVNYTWSKYIDDVGGVLQIGGRPNHQTYYDRANDKALSGAHIPHRFIASAVYELPVGRGRGLNLDSSAANAILGGWSLGIISELRSGVPFGVIESSNRLNTFSPLQRSNIIGDPELSTSRSRAELVREYFNTQAFAFPGTGKLGNAARTHMLGPGSATFDFSLLKDIPFGEGRYVQIRGEFFNLFNRPNFRNPAARRGRGNFGHISSTFDARIIQLGLRIVF